MGKVLIIKGANFSKNKLESVEIDTDNPQEEVLASGDFSNNFNPGFYNVERYVMDSVADAFQQNNRNIGLFAVSKGTIIKVKACSSRKGAVIALFETNSITNKPLAYVAGIDNTKVLEYELPVYQDCYALITTSNYACSNAYTDSEYKVVTMQSFNYSSALESNNFETNYQFGWYMLQTKILTDTTGQYQQYNRNSGLIHVDKGTRIIAKCSISTGGAVIALFETNSITNKPLAYVAGIDNTKVLEYELPVYQDCYALITTSNYACSNAYTDSEYKVVK